MGPSLTEPRLSRYDALSSSSGGGNETARVHQVTRRRGGGLAVFSACTAIGDAGDRVHERPLSRRYWASIAGVLQRSGRSRLFRRPKRDDRIGWARGDYGRLPALAAEFVRRRVNVLVATGGELSALAAKQATSTIPIVFVTGDPVKARLVESLNRPGGNATGSYVVTTEMQKRLSLLHELTPGVPLIGALLNPNCTPSNIQ